MMGGSLRTKRTWLRKQSMYNYRKRCMVCKMSSGAGTGGGYVVIPNNRTCSIISVCSSECMKSWSTASSGVKREMHYLDDKNNEVKEMKVYTGKVKDGKIEVGEPDGTQAVLIFETTVVKQVVKQEVPMAELEAEPEVVESEVVDVVVKKAKVAKAKVVKSAKRMRYHEGRNNSRIYRNILGMSIGEFGRRLKAGGFSGTKNEAVEKIHQEFIKQGYAGMWSRNKKLKVSVAASLAPFGFPYDRKPPVKACAVKPSKPRLDNKNKYRPSGLMDAPNNKSAHELWVEVLGEGVDAYIRRTLVMGTSPDVIINQICDSIVAKGYKPNRNSIGALVYIKAKQVS